MTVTHTDSQANAATAQDSPWLHRIAHVMRRFPLLGAIGQRLYRLTVPHYTLGVVGVLLDAQRKRVLLVEHVFHPVKPWGLPGGWLDRGENPAQAIEREFREETGLHVTAICPLLVERVPLLRGQMDIIYLCALNGDSQTIRLSNELLDYRWTALDALPPLFDSQHRAITQAAHMAALITHHPGGDSWTTDV